MIKGLYKQKGWTATSAIVRKNRVEVKLTIDRRYNFRCPKCGNLLRMHSKREIYVRDLPILERKVGLYVDVAQGYCTICKRYHTLRPELCHPSSGYTWRFMRQMSRFLVHAPARFLEDEFHVSYSSILRMDKEVLCNDIPKPKKANIQGILVDEKFLGPGKGYVTMVMDADTGEPLGMAPGRDRNGLESFFSRFNEEEKEKIKFLGIDRSNAYKAAAVRHLPHVIVCYDAYHFVRNTNEVLDRIRRATMKHPPYTYSSFMKGKRFVLLRGRETLDSDAKEELRKLSHLNRNLYIAYLLKEKFREVFRSKDENTAILRLILWIRMCMKSKVSQLKRFAKGISEKFNGIINGIRYRINSARIESANAAIKRIQSKACGLADMEYLFLKMRQGHFMRLQRLHKTSHDYYQQI